MPAISAETVAPPRVGDPDPTATDRAVVSVTTAPSGFEGEGFPVRRAFAGDRSRGTQRWCGREWRPDSRSIPAEPHPGHEVL